MTRGQDTFDHVQRCARGQMQKPGSKLWNGTNWDASYTTSETVDLWPDAYLDPGEGAAIRHQSLLKVKLDYVDEWEIRRTPDHPALVE